MAYHRHDAFDDHPGYQSMEDQGSPGYHSQGSDDPAAPGYNTGSGVEDSEEQKMSEFEKQIEEEQKPKYQKKDEEEQIKVQAAEQIHQKQDESENSPVKKKTKSSIEDAIDKAIKEEKEVAYLD